MSSHEENHAAPNVCSQDRGGPKYGPCACCVALAQVHFPHYHHETSASPEQYPYAAGYSAARGRSEGEACSACGQSGTAHGNGAGRQEDAESDPAAWGRRGRRAAGGTQAAGKRGSMSKFLSRYVSLAPGAKSPPAPGSDTREGEKSPGLKDDSPAPEKDAEPGDSAGDEVAVEIPRPRRIWQGVDGMAMTCFGILVPAAMFVLSCMSMPTRMTLVLLNHPLETIAEVAMVLSIPLLNYFVWNSLVGRRIKFVRLSSLAAGLAAGSALAVSILCIAGLFASNNQALADSGEAGAGLSWIAILALLAAAASIYGIFNLRASRDFASTKRQVVVLAALGALIPALVFAAAEARPWAVRIAERMAAAGTRAEQKQGLSLLRQLNPERDLRMECSDPRAAGICGLFIPVKPSAQHELYFRLTGKPYSFREFNNTDMSAMPDDYLSRNVVGEPVSGLSLARSTITGNVHPKTMSATLDWTFVFKNDTAQGQEARAEIGLPPGAVISGLTAWSGGEARRAVFAASGKAEGVARWTEVGHDSPAIVTDLGHGRVLIHCYPVRQDQESKISVRMTAPLNPERTRSASLAMPTLIASNFGVGEGDYAVRIRGPESLSSGLKTLKPDRAAGGDFTIAGVLAAADLKSNKLLIDTQRSSPGGTVAVADPLAWRMARQERRRLDELARQAARANHAQQPQEQVLVMVDGTRGIDSQIDMVRKVFARKHGDGARTAAKPASKPVPMRYVTQTLEPVSAAAPGHLVVVVDGSATTGDYSRQIGEALGKLPAGIPTTIILASQLADQGDEPLPLARGLAVLKTARFVGGQDNLKAVVKAAELAGETRGGAVLWIHGPQPDLNQEIYIMSSYTSVPAFYELTLGSGETDTYEFFKNHPEVGPFTAIPRNSNNLCDDMAAFFGRWSRTDSSYAIKLAMTTAKPAQAVPVSPEEAREVVTLHAAQRCRELIADQRLRMAATVAVRYGFVSPVSSALVSSDTPAAGEAAGVDPFSNPAAGADERSAWANPGREESAAASAAAADAAQVQGAASGAAAPGDGTLVQGVNTAGTVRVNNLANLETLLNIIANLAEIGMGLSGIVLVIHGLVVENVAAELMGERILLGRGARIVTGIGLILFGLAAPGMINWFVASARDANLFS